MQSSCVIAYNKLISKPNLKRKPWLMIHAVVILRNGNPMTMIFWLWHGCHQSIWVIFLSGGCYLIITYILQYLLLLSMNLACRSFNNQQREVVNFTQIIDLPIAPWTLILARVISARTNVTGPRANMTFAM